MPINNSYDEKAVIEAIAQAQEGYENHFCHT